MPRQDPRERIKNFDEVPFGYDTETAVRKRTDACSAKDADPLRMPCGSGHTAFIKCIQEKFDEGKKKLKERITSRLSADVFARRKASANPSASEAKKDSL